jgi:hypothetical protein
MKALLIAVIVTVVVAPQALADSLQQCTGPFRPCAIEVQATCSRDPNGQLRFVFDDAWGKWPRWERCVGRIFEAHGQKDPFKSTSGNPAGQQASGPLTVPYTEMLYPKDYGRD